MQRRWLPVAILTSLLAVGGCQGPGVAPMVGQSVSNPAQKATVSFSVAVGRAGYALKQLGGYKVADVTRINAHVHNHVNETDTPAASPMASAWNVLPANGVFSFTLGNLDYGTRYWLRLEAMRADGNVIGVIDEYSPKRDSPQTHTNTNNQRFQWFETLGATQSQLQTPVEVLIKLADTIYSGQAPVQIGFITGGIAPAVGPVTILTPPQGNASPTPTPSASIEATQYVVSTLAGYGPEGFVDGAGSQAQFFYPFGVAADANGHVYVADADNHSIRKVSPQGEVSTLTGVGYPGDADGLGFQPDAKASYPAGSQAQFSGPRGVAVDGAGNVYVADSGNHRIRKVMPDGTVSTLAGSTEGYADGVGAQARFAYPVGVAVDNVGNVYVADHWNHRIRKITPDGTVTTLAGSDDGYAEGTGTAARFTYPSGVAVDNVGQVYVADQGNHRIRKISPAGVVSTVAGSIWGYADGVGDQAQFAYPTGVALDDTGNVYVTDLGYLGDQWTHHRIRRVNPGGVVSTLAGATEGYADGVGTQAQFHGPFGIAVDGVGNVLVADTNNHRIRKVSSVR